MPAFATPLFSAGQAGLIGTAAAVAGSAQVNQLLGTHSNQPIYQGNRILLPEFIYSPAPFSNPWNTALSTVDVDQPFTMSGTTIGRVQLPVLVVGNGADLLVSLCSDSSGHPGTMITQTRIPATWLSQLAAVSAATAPASQYPTVGLTNSPVAASQFNMWTIASQVILPYNFPAITFVGVSAEPAATWYNGQIIIVGGVTGGAALTGVYTMGYNSTGTLAPSVPQPAFPNPNDGSSAMCVCVDPSSGAAVVVNTGGGTSFGGAPVTNVFTSTINASTGALSAWSAQTALPTAVQSHTMTAYNGYVYSVGGKGTGGAVTSTVNYAQVSNGQITAWSATSPLPKALQLVYTVAFNGYLLIAGGADGSLTAQSACYYAPINSNGSLGAWSPAPPLFAAAYDLNANAFANAQGALVISGSSSLVFGTSGPSWTWGQDTAGGSGSLPGFYDFGTGQVAIYALAPSGNEYGFAYFNLAPYPSIPLPATGLSNGATYHILMQQIGGNQANYLSTIMGANAYTTGGPTALTSPPGTYTWTTQPVGNGIGISIYDQTVSATPPVHTWEDGGARVSTFVYATTPDQRLLGLAEATRTSVQRNANSGFQSGIAPWFVSGGTVVQSSAQFYEGGTSAQITPSGSAANVFIGSENIACMPGQSIIVSAWMWFTSIVSGNASVSINWYTLGGSYISTSSNDISVAATTWTQLTNTFTAPATAYQYSIAPTLSGTPPASNIFYVDLVYSTDLITPQQSSVVEVTYPGTYPGGTNPATGLVELA
jgi:Carbohydrate binding domain